MPSIYRITYPNGKIYVGKDLTDTVAYFGRCYVVGRLSPGACEVAQVDPLQENGCVAKVSVFLPELGA